MTTYWTLKNMKVVDQVIRKLALQKTFIMLNMKKMKKLMKLKVFLKTRKR